MPDRLYITKASQIPDSFGDDGTLYIDVETYAGPRGDALTVTDNVLRILSVRGRGSDAVYVFDMMYLPYDLVLNRLVGKTLVAHNMAFDLPVLVRHGLPYPTEVRCTMVMSQVLWNGLPVVAGTHSLGECVKRYLERDIVKDQGQSDWSQIDLTPRQIEYAGDDVAVLPDLDKHLLQRLEHWRLSKIGEIENGIIPALVDMTLNGIGVDVAAWTERAKAAEVELAVREKVVLEQLPLPDPEPYKTVRRKKNGEPYAADVAYNERVEEANRTRKWNLASPLQVAEVFKRVGINLPNTAYETLVEHALDHPVLDAFMKWRDIEKQATSFGMDWLKHVRDGRVHPSWLQMKDTGRMGCKQPNIQQIPRGKCRKGIVAAPGHVLVRADFSQIEARVACKISGDKIMEDLYARNDDIHRYAAKAVLQKETVTDEERQIGKSLVFGLLFSMSAPKLRVYCRTNYGVKFSPTEAEVFRNRFFQAFPGLKQWHDRVRRVCNSLKEVRSLLGRRRVFYGDLTGLNMLGIALNTPVQGTAADMMKESVRTLWARRDERPTAKLVMLVHDEIAYQEREEEAETTAKWLKSIMVETGNRIIDPIPVDASVKIGRTWG